jgi:hypothetical protein
MAVDYVLQIGNKLEICLFRSILWWGQIRRSKLSPISTRGEIVFSAPRFLLIGKFIPATEMS